jgi:hypothetical protein
MQEHKIRTLHQQDPRKLYYHTHAERQSRISSFHIVN